jgi:hypothetical protein
MIKGWERVIQTLPFKGGGHRKRPQIQAVVTDFDFRYSITNPNRAASAVSRRTRSVACGNIDVCVLGFVAAIDFFAVAYRLAPRASEVYYEGSSSD